MFDTCNWSLTNLDGVSFGENLRLELEISDYWKNDYIHFTTFFAGLILFVCLYLWPFELFLIMMYMLFSLHVRMYKLEKIQKLICLSYNVVIKSVVEKWWWENLLYFFFLN